MRARRRRMISCAVPGIASRTARVPRSRASRLSSMTNSGFPAVRSVSRVARPAPTSMPPVAVTSRATASVASPRIAMWSDRVAIWTASPPSSVSAVSSWSRQAPTTRTGSRATVLSRNWSSRSEPGSVQCRSSSSSTTGRSSARPVTTAANASNKGNRAVVPSSAGTRPPTPSSGSSPNASRTRGPHATSSSAAVRRAVASRSTCVQTQNGGVPGSSQPEPCRTVAPSDVASRSSSDSSRVFPIPASPESHTRRPVPERAAVRCARRRAQMASRP